MNKWFAGCGNVKLFELHKKGRPAVVVCRATNVPTHAVSKDDNGEIFQECLFYKNCYDKQTCLCGPDWMKYE